MANQVQITDGTIDAEVDDSAHALQTSRAVHYRTRHSNGWISSYKWTDIGAGASVYFHIKTGGVKQPHGNFTVSTEAKTTFEFFEDPVLTDDGTRLAENCLNRQTPGIPGTACFRDPTVSADGTLLEINMLGSAGRNLDIGGTLTDRGYWLLKLNENYLIKITNNDTETKDVVIAYIWHEHEEGIPTRHSPDKP